jgi:AcrR family transcriptional regulator
MAKRDTKDLILRTSLALFNEFGAPNVSTNQIALEADISPGNLYYHYKSKNDIVIALFKRFLLQIQPLIDVPEDTVLEAQDLWFQLHLFFELTGHYRFVYRNLPDLSARIPDFDKAFRGLMLRQRQAASAMLGGLERRGALVIDAVEKEILVSNILLALTYWIPFAETLDIETLEDGTAQTRAIARVLLMVTPYLREPEHSEFANIAITYLTQT